MSDQEVVNGLKAGDICLYREPFEAVNAYANELELGIKIERLIFIGEGTMIWIKDAVAEHPLDAMFMKSWSPWR
jgi:hypothetical protein